MRPAHDPQDLEAFLLALNAAASEAIMPLFRADHGLVDKGGASGFDPVTKADRDAEAAIRALIGRRFPSHGVIGEEYGEDRPEAEFVWVIDPIDGTRAFIAGLPVWTTLIALRQEGRPVLGSIGQPFLGEVFLGDGRTARLEYAGGVAPLATRKTAHLKDAIIATTDPDACFNAQERQAWLRLRAAARLARFGCDAYAYAMVAAGSIDLVVEAGLKSWDIEAAVPILEGAGGQVVDWRGGNIGANGGQVIVSSHRDLTTEAVAHLTAASSPHPGGT
jgi:histidinol phosphatase-like enzyme (inositol monophosphatase family)